MQTSSFGSDFSTHEVLPKEYDFFPYKVVISPFPRNSGQFWTKHSRKVWENVLF
jgi:hypothetical protein